jgi:hypothetical protein
MLKQEPRDRPNVEDLLNPPQVTMRLQEKALRKNVQHMLRKEKEVKKKVDELRSLESEVDRREREIEEKER